MDIEQVRQQAAEAARTADKNTKPQIMALASQAEDTEKLRLAAVGQLEAAQQAAHKAQGEIDITQSNLDRVASRLLALIGG